MERSEIRDDIATLGPLNNCPPISLRSIGATGCVAIEARFST
jgi:hypothetical protein